MGVVETHISQWAAGPVSYTATAPNVLLTRDNGLSLAQRESSLLGLRVPEGGSHRFKALIREVELSAK